MYWDYKKAIMTRSRLVNKFCIEKTKKNKQAYTNKTTFE